MQEYVVLVNYQEHIVGDVIAMMPRQAKYLLLNGTLTNRYN